MKTEINMHNYPEYQMAKHVILLAIFLVSFASSAQSQNSPSTSSSQNRDIEAIFSAVNTTYPKSKASVIGTTPFNGLYEIKLPEATVYSSRDARYFILGRIVDMDSLEDISYIRATSMQRANVSKLNLKEAKVTKQGTGKKMLYVFPDHHGTISKSIEQNISKVNDLTTYYFPYQIDRLYKLSTVGWCQQDKQKVINHILNETSLDPETMSCESIIDHVRLYSPLARQLNLKAQSVLINANGWRVDGDLSAADIETHVNAK